jgi:PhnB protein
MQLTPYLNFNGQCADAFAHYAKVLGGTLEMMTHGNSPMAVQAPPDWKDKILHASLNAPGLQLLGSDVPPAYWQQPQGYALALTVPTVETARQLFEALSAGGKVTMAFAPTFWSPGYGMATDRFGIAWMVMAAAAA